MSDFSLGINFVWWGSALILELVSTALLWQLTAHLHWNTAFRLLTVWTLGAAFALCLLAAWLQIKTMFEDATKGMPLPEASFPLDGEIV